MAAILMYFLVIAVMATFVSGSPPEIDIRSISTSLLNDVGMKKRTTNSNILLSSWVNFIFHDLYFDQPFEVMYFNLTYGSRTWVNKFRYLKSIVLSLDCSPLYGNSMYSRDDTGYITEQITPHTLMGYAVGTVEVSMVAAILIEEHNRIVALVNQNENKNQSAYKAAKAHVILTYRRIIQYEVLDALREMLPSGSSQIMLPSGSTWSSTSREEREVIRDVVCSSASLLAMMQPSFYVNEASVSVRQIFTASATTAKLDQLSISKALQSHAVLTFPEELVHLMENNSQFPTDTLASFIRQANELNLTMEEWSVNQNHEKSDQDCVSGELRTLFNSSTYNLLSENSARGLIRLILRSTQSMPNSGAHGEVRPLSALLTSIVQRTIRNPFSVSSAPYTGMPRNREFLVQQNVSCGGSRTLVISDYLLFDYVVARDNSSILLKFDSPALSKGKWVAFGWGGDSGSMPNADIIMVVHLDTAELKVMDMYTTGFSSPREDSVLGGTSDITVVKRELTGTGAVVWVNKTIAQTDSQTDKRVLPGAVGCIFATGPVVSGMNRKHTQALKLPIDLLSNTLPSDETLRAALATAGQSSLRDKRIIHGILMASTWGVNLLIAIWVARYQRHTTWWIGAHRTLGTIGTITTWPLFFLARGVSTHTATAHSQIGLAMTVLGSVQSFIGTLSHVLVEYALFPKLKKHISRLHILMGYTCCIISFVQIPLGVIAFGAVPQEVKLIVYVWMSVISCMFIVSEMILQVGRYATMKLRKKQLNVTGTLDAVLRRGNYWRMVKNSLQASSSSTSLTDRLFTMSEVEKHNVEFDAWVALNGKVLNVTTFMGVHPGGKQYLIKNAGTDVTDLFASLHSLMAVDVAKMYVIGELIPDDTAAPTATELQEYSWEQIDAMTNEETAVVVIDGMVYNVAPYLDAHPGGRTALVGALGRDVSDVFHRLHTSKGMKRWLDAMRIGFVTVRGLPYRGGRIQITRSEFENRVRSEAEQWLIIDDMIVDVADWGSRHPGGKEVLRKYMGVDATKAFNAHHTSTERLRAFLLAYTVGSINASVRVPPKTTPYPESPLLSTSVNLPFSSKEHTEEDSKSLFSRAASLDAIALLNDEQRQYQDRTPVQSLELQESETSVECSPRDRTTTDYVSRYSPPGLIQ